MNYLNLQDITIIIWLMIYLFDDYLFQCVYQYLWNIWLYECPGENHEISVLKTLIVFIFFFFY